MKTAPSLLVILCLALTACAINPVTGKRDFTLVSESNEIRQGSSFHQQIVTTYGIYDDPELQAYVNRIGQELASKSHRSHLKFRFTVLDSPDINAFALPGGYIYITRGIMAFLDSEAELAGVLGHEIGHVTARHSIRQQSGQVASDLFSILITAATGLESLGNISQQLGAGLVRGYGRDHELEADRLGAEYLHQTGYDPETMLKVIGVLKDQEVYEQALATRQGRQANIYHGVFSTHPRNDARLKSVVRAARKLSIQDYRDHNQTTYRAQIDGMVWGPSIKQGVVNANRFAHPYLGFSLQLPPAWQAHNNPQFLELKHADSNALMQIGLVTAQPDETLKQVLQRLTKRTKLAASRTDYGVTARISISNPDGGEQPARISAIAIKDQVVLTLLGTSGKQQFASSDRKFIEVNQSFRRLSPAQAAAVRVPRLQLVARADRNFDELARQSAIGDDAVSILRLLNRAFPDGDIRAIEQLKTVTLDAQ